MIKKIGIGLALVIALVLALAAVQPNSFRVERSIAVQAPAAKIFPLLNDFHHFASWSPWQKLDSTMKISHSGSPAGPGAVYTWEGNKDVGSGRMEVLQQEPNSSLTIKLDFSQPFEAHNTTEYTLTPDGAATTVTWAMYGPSPFMSKLMGIFVSMDSMVGKDFERGLVNLKAVAEKP